MEKRIRRLGIFMLLCLVALFVQLNNIQVLKANSLATNPQNPRVQLAARTQPRGDILSSDGSHLGHFGTDQQRVLQVPAGLQRRTPRCSSPRSWATTRINYGNFNGVESDYNSFLVAHNRPAKSLPDLLTNQTVADNVTSDHRPQSATAMQAAPGRRPRCPRCRPPSRRWCSTPPPAPSWPCTRIPPSIPTRWSRQTPKQRRPLGLPSSPRPATRCGPAPTRRSTRRAPPQGCHHLRRYPPAGPGHVDYPVPTASRCPNRDAAPVTNYQHEHCGGTLQAHYPSRATPTFALHRGWAWATVLRTPRPRRSDSTSGSRSTSRPARWRRQFPDRGRLSPAAPRPRPMKSAFGQQNVTGLGPADGHGGRHRGQRRGGDDPPRDGPDPRLPGQPGASSTPKPG